MTQTRWLCHACRREWAYAHGWDQSRGCPACQSHSIESITYKPVFPGADIRMGTDVADLAPVEPSAVDPVAHNQTLAMSSPEFG